MRQEQDYTMLLKTATSRQGKYKKYFTNLISRMTDIKWYSIHDLYTVENYRITHKKEPATKWIRLPCVYKIKINNTIVEVGRSDTCKKHGGAEKVRKALVNLLNIFEHNKSVTKTKRWEKIRLRHKPNSSNIKIGIIKTNAVAKIYAQENKGTY